MFLFAFENAVSVTFLGKIFCFVLFRFAAINYLWCTERKKTKYDIATQFFYKVGK